MHPNFFIAHLANIELFLYHSNFHFKYKILYTYESTQAELFSIFKSENILRVYSFLFTCRFFIRNNSVDFLFQNRIYQSPRHKNQNPTQNRSDHKWMAINWTLKQIEPPERNLQWKNYNPNPNLQLFFLLKKRKRKKKTGRNRQSRPEPMQDSSVKVSIFYF